MPASNTLSVCCWVNLTTDRNAVSTLFFADATLGGVIYLRTAADGTSIQLEDSLGTVLALVNVTVPGWYFVAFATDNATADAYWAAAGAAALSTATTNPFPAVAYTAPWISLTFFGHPTIQPITGVLALCRLWEAKLTATEMLAEYRSAAPVRAANLIDSLPLITAATKLDAKVGTWVETAAFGTEFTAVPPAVSYQAGMMAAA